MERREDPPPAMSDGCCCCCCCCCCCRHGCLMPDLSKNDEDEDEDLDDGGEVAAWPTPMFAEFSLSVVAPNMVAGRMDGRAEASNG